MTATIALCPTHDGDDNDDGIRCPMRVADVSNSDDAKLLQPRAKGKGVGKGYNLRQARRKCAELVKQPSLHRTPYGMVVKQLMVDTESVQLQLGYIYASNAVHLHMCA